MEQQENIFTMLDGIKTAANELMSIVLDTYGSDTEKKIVLNDPIPVYTFTGEKQLTEIRKNEDGSILYVCDENEIAYPEIVVESILKIAYTIAEKFGFGKMFDELFSGSDDDE
jgi:hypothetical protein